MVDYNKFAKTFAKSRKNLKWEEIDYFSNFLKSKKNLKILDIGCGSGRLLGELIKNDIHEKEYLGVDLSEGLINIAKKDYPGYNFLELNMLDLDKIDAGEYDVIFLIASFHHLKNTDERIKVLKNVYDILSDTGKVYITNWALNSNLNSEKYKNNIIDGSKNSFGNYDYDIKIGGFSRIYHCFDLKELKYLFEKTGFNVLENCLFKNDKNFVSIVEKK